MFFHNVLSMDIGNHSIKMVIGRYIKDTIVIQKAICIPTPINCILNGKIIDSIKLQEALNHILSFKEDKIKKVIFTIESDQMITRQLILPYAAPKQLSQMIQYKVLQKFPDLFEKRVLQYEKLEDLSIDGIQKCRIILASLPKSLIKDYWDLGKSFCLQPILLDSHFNSISKLFSLDKMFIHKEETVAVLDLGHEWTHIHIFYRGVLQVNKTLPYDCNNWMEEIERVFIYHSSKNLGNEIHKIYLIGGKANQAHIKASLEKYFGILVEALTHMNSIRTESLDEYMDIKLYLNAIGAMIRR